MSPNSATPRTWQAGLKAVRGELIFFVAAWLVLTIPFLRPYLWAVCYISISTSISVVFSYLRVTRPELVAPLPLDSPRLRKPKLFRRIAGWSIPGGFVAMFATAAILELYHSCRTTQVVSGFGIFLLAALAVFYALDAYLKERIKPITPPTSGPRAWPRRPLGSSQNVPLHSESWGQK